MVIVLMGVSGSGKTTVGKLLASQLGWQFADADDYHPAANIEKMRSGVPLTDTERAPWLAALRGQISEWVEKKKDVFLACSALKRKYREILQLGPEVQIVYIKGTPQLLQQRLRERVGHYMKEWMLDSQLAALEEPEGENVMVVDAARSPAEIVAEVQARLRLAKTAE